MADTATNRPFGNLRSLVGVIGDRPQPEEPKRKKPAAAARAAASSRVKPAAEEAGPPKQETLSVKPAPSPSTRAGQTGRDRTPAGMPAARRPSAQERKRQQAVPAARRAGPLRREPGETPARAQPAKPQAPAGTGPSTPVLSLMPGLPVSEHGDELVKAVRENQVIVVCGETGSGKTTQLPKICLLAGRGVKGMIGHTQPRRIAASSVARRIAEEMHTELGEVVGYKVRFTDRTQPGARIRLMTDGILLAETQGDPQLRRYDTIIIDEAHERSVNIDFLLGYLRRLLRVRRDLKVIVTSATIDAERFAKHFSGDGREVPVFTISGRVYPVEIRWRPPGEADEDDDRTKMDALADACDELEMAGSGDILVFLPGEREIREAAEALRRRHRPGTVEILPLYARLPAEEQERIFRSRGARRIVLATNVAETSITVPGIRYVVDTGLARVKRYSFRNKVEQLLVEPISQASASQRAGRCGRTANGICIRLYDEKDWAGRPPYTDPEILRSNLAAVILRMKALKLGDVREFPFLQAPAPRAIADGLALLSELNAVDRAGELTETGRELARLPVDPRLGRMLLAAHENGSLKEALIIVSGLSVQDPRERPAEAAQAADAAHRAFADEKSDFLSYLRMWRWYEDAREHKESNRRFNEELHRRFLSPKRIHEWRDVWHQLCELTAGLGWTQQAASATYEQIHSALLTGLLGNLGMRQLDADFRAPPYLGARGIHFWVWPGSSLAKKGGVWIMAAELVETSRLFARCAASIEPEWIERAAGHLIKKSWTEPHWEKKRGEVVALERGALYGLTVYAGRRVGLAPHDPALAREIFIREALVGEELETQAPFYAHNRRLVREIRDIEAKSRRPDVLVDEESIFEFYDMIIPAGVCGSVTLDTWRREAERDNPKLLWLTRAELMRKGADGVTADFYPKTMEQAGVAMQLTYHFEPGAPRDGVTLTVPIFMLNQVDPVRCGWLVPGMLKEKVQCLVKSLPQRLRRHCVPIAQYAAGLWERTSGRQKGSMDLVDALIADIRENAGVSCERTDFREETLPRHLFMNFKVVDEHGRQLDMGRNLAELRASLGREAQEVFRSVAEADQSVAGDLADNITGWTFGELPEILEISRKGQTLTGHPALVDRGDCCSLEVFDDPLQAKRMHRAGLRRLFILQLREQVKYLERNLGGLQRAQVQACVVGPAAAAFPGFEELRADAVAAAVEAAAMAGPWPVNQQEFEKRKNDARGRLSLLGQETGRLVESVASELSGLPKRLQAARGWPAAVKDVESQVSRLFPKHFILETPPEQLRHYPRYVKAACIRLEKLRDDPARDAARMADIERLAAPYWREVASRKGVVDERLGQFRWLLEELRVSLFAQELRTPMPVSVKRLTKVWESIRRL